MITPVTEDLTRNPVSGNNHIPDTENKRGLTWWGHCLTDSIDHILNVYGPAVVTHDEEIDPENGGLAYMKGMDPSRIYLEHDKYGIFELRFQSYGVHVKDNKPLTWSLHVCANKQQAAIVFEELQKDLNLIR